jgi:hypothetical protein
MTKGKGLNPVLDYLMIGLKLPLIYSPLPYLFTSYSIAYQTLLEHKQVFSKFNTQIDSSKRLLSVILDALHD